MIWNNHFSNMMIISLYLVEGANLLKKAWSKEKTFTKIIREAQIIKKHKKPNPNEGAHFLKKSM
jgi:hypothetical protein